MSHKAPQKRHELTDTQWSKLEALLPPGRPGRPGGDVRRFLNGVLWISKTGSPWRDLPEAYGSWIIVYQRFSYWSKSQRFEALFKALQEPDLEWLTLDSTSVKAHQASAGAKKNMVGKP